MTKVRRTLLLQFWSSSSASPLPAWLKLDRLLIEWEGNFKILGYLILPQSYLSLKIEMIPLKFRNECWFFWTKVLLFLIFLSFEEKKIQILHHFNSAMQEKTSSFIISARQSESHIIAEKPIFFCFLKLIPPFLIILKMNQILKVETVLFWLKRRFIFSVLCILKASFPEICSQDTNSSYFPPTFEFSNFVFWWFLPSKCF